MIYIYYYLAQKRYGSRIKNVQFVVKFLLQKYSKKYAVVFRHANFVAII